MFKIHNMHCECEFCVHNAISDVNRKLDCDCGIRQFSGVAADDILHLPDRWTVLLYFIPKIKTTCQI